MDVDLLFTRQGEAGLISRGNFIKKIAGAVLDTVSGTLTLEFVDMDYMELNIPIEDDFTGTLDYCNQIHIGGITNGSIAQAYQVPFMFLDDPYRNEAMQNVRQSSKPLVAFENFVRRCVTGQPVHREDLGDEDNMGCVLGDASPSSLEFAPHLARRHSMERAPRAAPNVPGINVPGLGGSGGSQGGGGIIGRILGDDDED